MRSADWKVKPVCSARTRHCSGLGRISMAGQPGVLESSIHWMTAAISPGREDAKRLTRKSHGLFRVQDVEEQRHLRGAVARTGAVGDEVAQPQPHVVHPFPRTLLPHPLDHLRLDVEGVHRPPGESGRRQGEVAAAAAEFDHVPKADVQDEQGQGHPNAFGFARKGLCSRAMRLAA